MTVAARRALSTGRVLALIACLALVVAPHALRVPLWIAATAGIVMGARALVAWRGGGLPPGWALGALALGSTFGIWLSFGMVFGRDAAVALLILMLCLKMMELRSTRDASVLIQLGYFLVITNFLYSQSIPMALYLLGCVWLITACLMAFQHRSTLLDPRSVLRRSALMLGQAIPLMLVLFLLFPRIQGPLWGLPQASRTALSGLSESMSPGSLSSLSLSDAVAFRVEFEAPAPPPGKLYWRGPVMWDFDGRTWRGGDTAPLLGRDVEIDGSPIRYSVTLEPHNMRWMFAIDLPAQRLEGAFLTQDFQLLALRPVRSRVRYVMSSSLSYRYGRNESRRNLQRALRLPEGYNPRTLELAAALRARNTTDRDVVRAALNLFRTEPYFYTLVPPELGRDGIDEFLFQTRRGFCEHFAAAFVFLMRAAGIPARVVTGYQGGVLNPIGDYLIVRQSEAHAWAEVWYADEGWVRVDPTGAVSPQRIETGIAGAVPESDPLPLMVRTGSEWLQRLRFTWDAAANGWNQWVLGYTPEQQLRLFERAGIAKANWQNLVVALVGITALVVLILAAMLFRRLRRTVRDPVLRAWLAFSRKLGTQGLARHAGEGPMDYARRVAQTRPALASDAMHIAELYSALRYGRQQDAAGIAHLARLVRAFRAA
ncbi:MAG: DUF3488 and transglutaminase-like domain-containing protein [Gammaproteobacteria bacterium]